MEKFGEVLGWIAAVCYFVSVANFFIKRIFKGLITRLPKDSGFRKAFQFFMRLLIKYHRYAGIAAGIFALLHLCWQIVNVRLSYSGVAVTVLMSVTALLGVLVAYGHKGALVKAHRPAALAVLAVILFHIITKL